MAAKCSRQLRSVTDSSTRRSSSRPSLARLALLPGACSGRPHPPGLAAADRTIGQSIGHDPGPQVGLQHGAAVRVDGSRCCCASTHHRRGVRSAKRPLSRPCGSGSCRSWSTARESESRRGTGRPAPPSGRPSSPRPRRTGRTSTRQGRLAGPRGRAGAAPAVGCRTARHRGRTGRPPQQQPRSACPCPAQDDVHATASHFDHDRDGARQACVGEDLSLALVVGGGEQLVTGPAVA